MESNSLLLIRQYWPINEENMFNNCASTTHTLVQ
jgi:hypothetical protein